MPNLGAVLFCFIDFRKDDLVGVEGHATSELEPRADTDAEPKRGVEANAE